MPDKLTPEQRSFSMSRIKGEDTGLELRVRSALHRERVEIPQACQRAARQAGRCFQKDSGRRVRGRRFLARISIPLMGIGGNKGNKGEQGEQGTLSFSRRRASEVVISGVSADYAAGKIDRQAG
jgi:hypothetical protein